MVLSQFPSVPLEKIIKNASPDAINLIYSMLRWDPNKRITASQILQHTYFYDTNSFLPKEISGADDSFYPFKKS